MNVAIIPARGGSKRIPGKNTRKFAGRPIIAYPVETAIKSRLFDKVIVSTDSETIAEIAREAGAEVPFIRPAELATDFSTTAEVITHALLWLKNNDQVIEHACCIYPTAVLIRPSNLIAGYELLRKEAADTVFSVTTFDYPVFRALKINTSNRIEMVWPEHELTRSNDLPALVHDAGQFYWLKVDSFLENGRLFSSNVCPVVLPRYMAVDIDTEEDWSMAERLFMALNRCQ